MLNTKMTTPLNNCLSNLSSILSAVIRLYCKYNHLMYPMNLFAIDIVIFCFNLVLNYRFIQREIVIKYILKDAF